MFINKRLLNMGSKKKYSKKIILYQKNIKFVRIMATIVDRGIIQFPLANEINQTATSKFPGGHSGD